MARTGFRVSDKFSLRVGRHFPKQFGNCPRTITVEDHDSQALLFQKLVNAHNGFGGRTLEKGARFVVDDLAAKIIGAGVANIEFDGFIEFDEFEQISLTFIRFLRRFVLSKRGRRKKDKTKSERGKLQK